LKQVVGGSRQCQDRARLFGLDASGKRGRKVRAQHGGVSGQIAKIARIPQLAAPGEMIKNCSSDDAAVFGGTHRAQLIADAIAGKTYTPLGRLLIGEDVQRRDTNESPASAYRQRPQPLTSQAAPPGE
jgi:hypothetical protein